MDRCAHVERLLEYLNNYKLTVAPNIRDRRGIGVYCRQCDKTTQVTLPLIDDVEGIPVAKVKT